MVVLAVLAGLAAGAAAAAETMRLDPRRAIAASEQARGRLLGEYVLTGADGRPLPLRDLRGKPMVVSLVYTGCGSICPLTTQHLIGAVEEAGRVVGVDRFNVLTVGFDVRNDTPGRMAQFAVQQGVRLANWRLAAGDAAVMEPLLRDLGFSFVPIGGGFDHVTQTTIVDRDGRIYRHLYGDSFPLPLFVEALKEVIYGPTTPLSLAGIADRIRFICTTFDPASGRYRIDYGLAFGAVLAGLSLLLMGGLIVREWRRTRRA